MKWEAYICFILLQCDNVYDNLGTVVLYAVSGGVVSFVYHTFLRTGKRGMRGEKHVRNTLGGIELLLLLTMISHFHSTHDIGV